MSWPYAATLAVQAGITGACVYVATDLLCTYHRETSEARCYHRSMVGARWLELFAWAAWNVGTVENPGDPSPVPRGR